ncbi:CbiQ family ECF transporter T component [Aeromicrobium camelliae]|nr:CbiQ family ECF transporter T component [Aeromicrobium camelliae]
MNSPLGMHRPGTSPLHRLRPGTKLLGLVAFAVVVIAVPGAGLTLALLGVALVVAVIAGLTVRELAQTLRTFALIAVALFAFQAWQNGIDRGLEVVAGLLALIVAATVVTATTPTDAMVDTITRAARPWRRLGADPERIGLAFALVLAALPRMLELAHETHSAARARGLERNPRAYATPLVLRAVAQARETGAALHARGIGDD